MATLNDIRARLKAGKTSSKAAPPSKSDPLAAVRSQIKAGKEARGPKDLSKLTVAQRLARLEALAGWVTQLGSEKQNAALQAALDKAAG